MCLNLIHSSILYKLKLLFWLLIGSISLKTKIFSILWAFCEQNYNTIPNRKIIKLFYWLIQFLSGVFCCLSFFWQKLVVVKFFCRKLIKRKRLTKILTPFKLFKLPCNVYFRRNNSLMSKVSVCLWKLMTRWKKLAFREEIKY